jgi:coenzyme F420-reducing hydrogenase beta subunit
MIKLAKEYECTGCGICAYKCPKQCIKMTPNMAGVIYPQINKDICIECHCCEKVCPIIPPPINNYPLKCYAAWNSNQQERKTSASGGIAIGIYKWAIKHNYLCIGVSMNSDFSATFKIAQNVDQLSNFKNSKYVFSEPYLIYPKLSELLKEGKKAIIIGLPCQIAGFKKIFSKYNVIFIDLVCHGTVPTLYLQQHINYIEKIIRNKATRVSFRAPEKGTETYHFTLYDKTGNIIYSKRTSDGENYNYGFHKAVCYRENCYHCKFAQPKRCSDITLGDFHGLGRLIPCDYNEKKVSNILINTTQGDLLIKSIIQDHILYVDERPVEEPILGDSQLQHPSKKSKQRIDFEKLIKSSKNFNYEIIIKQVIKKSEAREKKDKFIQMLKKIYHKLF